MNPSKKESIRWSIDLASAQKSVGTIGLFNFNKELLSAEIGYIVGRDFWGCGVATSAVLLTIKYAFNELSLNALTAESLSRNHASIRILEKLGFDLVGEFEDNGDPMIEYRLIKA